MAIATAPTLRNRLGRAIGTRFRGVKGVDRLLRTLHHPDKREEWYFETIAPALPSGPKYQIESRWFTEWTTYFYGSQDEAIHRWIQEHARPDWVAFDIGMNFGYFACLLGQTCAEVHGFEPIPWLAERAKANVILNDLNNTHVNSVALSKENGFAKINVPADRDSNWGTSSLVHHSSSSNSLEVRTQTVDAFVEELTIERLDFIKIDVEGAEHLVLQGAMSTLAAHRPIVILENNAESLGECVSLLQKLEYRLCTTEGAPISPGTALWPHDLLALPAVDVKGTARSSVP
jgi:FkbM family methyltransferase